MLDKFFVAKKPSTGRVRGGESEMPATPDVL